MSVEQTGIVDIISVDQRSGDVILTVSDHLDWSDSLQHQAILQTKLNAYLAFAESGEILQQYPNSRGRKIIFNVVFKFSPDHEGRAFLMRAKEVIKSAGFDLRDELFAASCDN